MERKNKSIILIGPACVGKTLISEELSKQTGYPIVSVDDIVSFVDLEIKGYIANDKYSIEQYKQLVSNAYDDDFRFALGEGEKDLRNKRLCMIKSYVKDYKRYKKMFGGLEQFYDTYDVFERFHDIVDYLSPNVVVWMEKFFYTRFIELIISNIDSPIILDSPAFYGFKQDKLTKKELEELREYGFNMRSTDLEQIIKNQIKQNGYSVLLEPGIDYKERRVVDTIKTSSDMLANNVENYYPYSDVLVSVNGLFNNPKDNSLKSRYYFDVRSQSRREQLKDNSEIKNIVYSILQNVSELDNIIM